MVKDKRPIKDITVNGRVYRQVFQDFTKLLAGVEDRERLAWGNPSYLDVGNIRIPMRIVDIRYELAELIVSKCSVEDWVLPSVQEIISEEIRDVEKRTPGFKDLNLNGLLLLDEDHYRERIYGQGYAGKTTIINHDDIKFALCRYEERPKPVIPKSIQWGMLVGPMGIKNL